MLSGIDFADRDIISVINDDRFGCRIGSGGAFINMISGQYEPGRKMLIINAGGFSKRCFHYAVKGKLFGTFYDRGKKTTLFESFLTQTSAIADRIDSGAIVCCSDILLDLKDTDLGGFAWEENTGFGIRSPLDVCSGHGVFIGEDRKEVKLYAHKKSAEELKRLTGSELAPADTGLAYFTDAFLDTVYRLEREHDLVEVIRKNKLELNLYTEIYPLLAEEVDELEYLYGDLQNEAHLSVRQLLWEALSPLHMRFFTLGSDRFIHFGTVREAAENIKYLAGTEGAVRINSVLEGSEINGRAVLENCFLKNCVVGDNSFVSDISLRDVRIPDNALVCGVKTKDGKCVTVCCPADENPKETVNGTELWKTPRFFPADTFTESFDRFCRKADSRDMVSMEQITQNADIDHFCRRQAPEKSGECRAASEEYKKRSVEVIGNYFKNTPVLKTLEFRRELTELRLPVRLNLSGTWTDAMPYCTDNGGQVINMSVMVDGALPICVSLQKLDRHVIRFVSDDHETEYDIGAPDDGADEFDVFILHKAALKVLGIGSDTVLKHGFCLKTQVFGIEKGSGLGISSLLLLGCIVVFEKALGLTIADGKKIRMVFAAEQLMKTGGGWQDQICGVSFGLNNTTAAAGIEQHTVIEKIPVSSGFQNVINERFAIVYTGQRHYGRFIVYDIMNRYLEGEPEVRGAFEDLRRLNVPMKEAFLREDIKKIADLLNRQFDLLKKLSENITDPQIDFLAEECRSYADGVCICGAGAGGYLMLVLKKDKRFDELAEHLNVLFPDTGITVRHISFYSGQDHSE